MKEYQLTKAPIGLVHDRNNWWSFDPKPELDAIAFEEGPKRTKNQFSAQSNQWQSGHSDKVADILGVALEAYAADACGFDATAITYVYDSAPSGKDADFGGMYEVKRTNQWCGDLKYRVDTNADHYIIHGFIDRDYDPETDSLVIRQVHLLGWNLPAVDLKHSKHYGYDNRGEEVRKIPVVRRRPMDTLPLLAGVSHAA